MKVVIAVDSFKGSLSSIEAGNAVREGILRACGADAAVFPLADGGEGGGYGLDEVLDRVDERAIEIEDHQLHESSSGSWYWAS